MQVKNGCGTNKPQSGLLSRHYYINRYAGFQLFLDFLFHKWQAAWNVSRETSSAWTAYLSFRPVGQNSIIPSCLLSRANPLRWALIWLTAFGGQGVCLSAYEQGALTFKGGRGKTKRGPARPGGTCGERGERRQVARRGMWIVSKISSSVS